MGPRRQPTAGFVNSEGMPIKKPSPRGDRITYILVGLLQLVAVALIVTQLKAIGLLPAWVDTDWTSFYKFVPRNPLFSVPCGHAPSRNLLLLSSRVVFDDSVEPGAVHIKRSRFQRVERQSALGAGELAAWMRAVESVGGTVRDYGDLAISPGVVDAHTHLNEPGRLQWEGLTRGTYAAAAGGVTTLVDMPLNCDPVITTTRLLQRKIARVWEKSRVDMAMWAGLVGSNAYDHVELGKMLSAGAVGLKGFMSPSGIDDFPLVTQRDIEAALPVLLRHRKPLVLHAEVVLDVDGTCDAGCDPRNHSAWLATRPPVFEVTAAMQIVSAMRAVRAASPGLWRNATQGGSAFRVHIAHLASAEALPIYSEAIAEGLPISLEATPHHLTFAAEDVPLGATPFKCAPPLRDAANRAALVSALGDGTITVVGSDHSPSEPRLKSLDTGNFLTAWGGIAGLQYTLPAMNTIARAEGWSLAKLAQFLSTEPAKLAGLFNKGRIAKGYDADLVIWDPSMPANTSIEGCLHRHKESAYRDVKLFGDIEATFVRGSQVYDGAQGLYERRVCGSAVLRKTGPP